MVCKACGFEHESWVRCEVAKARDAATQELPGLPLRRTTSGPLSSKQPVVAASIKQAQDFIRKVGRPRLDRSLDEKRKLRAAYMRRKRAQK